MPATDSSAIRNIVLVHGGFVDGSGWAAVYGILKKDGYDVVVVQNPTRSLADDVAVTKRAIAAQGGPVLLVGHSYGGVVITEAGTDPKVAGLVYIAAFAPDKGESVSSLIKDPPPGAPVPPILPPQDGFLFLDKAKFHFSFAGDVDADTAAFMASSQVPWGVEALSGTITEPAWKTKPSWYLVSTEDRMNPTPAKRTMSKRDGTTVQQVASDARSKSAPPKYSPSSSNGTPTSGSERSDAIDLDACPSRERADLDGRARRWRLLEVAPIGLVDLGEVGHVGDEDGRLH